MEFALNDFCTTYKQYFKIVFLTLKKKRLLILISEQNFS